VARFAVHLTKDQYLYYIKSPQNSIVKNNQIRNCATDMRRHSTEENK
jgi:hypothetical protein